MSNYCLYLFLVLANLIGRSRATHFRGGLLSWSPAGNNMVKFNFRISWRRSYDQSTFCDRSTILSGQLIGAKGNLSCQTGCSGVITPLLFQCTDFSFLGDWTSGVGSYIYTFPPGTLEFSARYEECCWISLLKGGGAWSLTVSGNLGARRDTGAINHSPISATPPIVKFQLGCNHTYVIPVTDADDDIVRCRFGKSVEECGGVCNTFDGAILDEERCTLHYNAMSLSAEAQGFYAVALVIEDFSLDDLDVPISRVPLQFLAEVTQLHMLCTESPEFISPPTPLDSICIPVPIDSTFNGTIEVDSLSPTQNIVDLITVSPQGLIQTPLLKLNDRRWAITFMWKAQASQRGPNIFCFFAINSAGCTEGKARSEVVGDVSINCYMDGMDITVNNPTQFTGMMYVRGQFRNDNCRAAILPNTTKSPVLYLSYDKCKHGIDKVNNNLFFVVIVQPHLSLVTSRAKAYKLICQHNDQGLDKRVSSHMRVNSLASDIALTKNGPAPKLKMYITDHTGHSIESAKLGDRLMLKIEVQPENIFGISAKDCYARNDEDELEYKFIDSMGCTLDADLFSNFNQESSQSKAISSTFYAFKFPISTSLLFHCSVRVCIDRCQKVDCDVGMGNATLQKVKRDARPVDVVDEEGVETKRLNIIVGEKEFLDKDGEESYQMSTMQEGSISRIKCFKRTTLIYGWSVMALLLTFSLTSLAYTYKYSSYLINKR